MEAERMRKVKKVVDELKATLTMTLVAVTFAVGTILYKIATLDGMDYVVLNAYRFIFATAIMLPLALFYERKPKLSWKVFFMTFLCGLFGGTLFQALYLESLVLTSATFISACFNLIPAITFILAICFRLEKLNLGEAAGRAKMIGTIVGIGGAMIMTFVKGPHIPTSPSHLHLHHCPHTYGVIHNDIARKVLGVACALGSCFAYAFWLIIQGVMSRTPNEYPSHLTTTALMSTMAAIQSTAFALCVERDWSQWKLGWDIKLFTVVYSGVVASGIMVMAIAWCVEMKGPLFVSMFSPVLLLVVVIGSSFILDENLFLGSVVGAVLIVLGLYSVLWGKAKEAKKTNKTITQQQSALPKIDHPTSNDRSNTSKNKVHDQHYHDVATNAKHNQEDQLSSNV